MFTVEKHNTWVSLLKNVSLNYYISTLKNSLCTEFFVNSGGLLLFTHISVSALLSLFIVVGVVGEILRRNACGLSFVSVCVFQWVTTHYNGMPPYSYRCVKKSPIL